MSNWEPTKLTPLLISISFLAFTCSADVQCHSNKKYISEEEVTCKYECFKVHFQNKHKQKFFILGCARDAAVCKRVMKDHTILSCSTCKTPLCNAVTEEEARDRTLYCFSNMGTKVTNESICDACMAVKFTSGDRSCIAVGCAPKGSDSKCSPPKDITTPKGFQLSSCSVCKSDYCNGPKGNEYFTIRCQNNEKDANADIVQCGERCYTLIRKLPDGARYYEKGCVQYKTYCKDKNKAGAPGHVYCDSCNVDMCNHGGHMGRREPDTDANIITFSHTDLLSPNLVGVFLFQILIVLA